MDQNEQLAEWNREDEIHREAFADSVAKETKSADRLTWAIAGILDAILITAIIILLF